MKWHHHHEGSNHQNRVWSLTSAQQAPYGNPQVAYMIEDEPVIFQIVSYKNGGWSTWYLHRLPSYDDITEEEAAWMLQNLDVIAMELLL